MTRRKFGDKWIEVGFNEQDVDEIKLNTPGERTPQLYRTTRKEYKRTGNLQRGWMLEAMTGDIVNPVHYAAFVEFGTFRMAGHFMVVRSLPAIGNRLSRDIARQLGEGPQPLFKLPEIVIQI